MLVMYGSVVVIVICNCN